MDLSNLTKALTELGIAVATKPDGGITIDLDTDDHAKSLEAVLAGDYQAHTTISLGIIGTGNVGGTLVQQIREQAPVLKSQFGFTLRIVALASSERMVLGDPAVDLERWRDDMADPHVLAPDLRALEAHLLSVKPHACIIDCTGSDMVSGFYDRWLRAGIHLITPNKKPNAGPMSFWSAIRKAQLAANTHFFYESNVCAGLPVIGTIQSLYRTGDRFLHVEGVFSGTLSYIFNEFDGTVPFSKVVAKAQALGYTEPDPRDDLAGIDVQRKTIILAREIGIMVEPEDVPVQSLIPAALNELELTVPEFMEKLADHDQELADMCADAIRDQQKLRYVGIIDVPSRQVKVEIRKYPLNHPFGRLQGSDNICSFTTMRYKEQPLVIQVS